jgi:hypothetical protein
MNLEIYKVKVDITLLGLDDRRDIEAKSGMHIVCKDKEVFLKRTIDSFCTPINTYPAFIQANSKLFEKIIL